MNPTPEGWFRDLNDADTERYWDGAAWTERTRAVGADSRPMLHPSERYSYDTESYRYDAPDVGRVAEPVVERETRTPATHGASPVEERKSFNPLWLLLPLLLLLGAWFVWQGMDDDEPESPGTTTSTSVTTSATTTESSTTTSDTTTSDTATDTATGAEITLPSVEEMTTRLTDAGVENAEAVAQAVQDGGPYTADTLVQRVTDAMTGAGVDSAEVSSAIDALNLN